MKVMPYLYFVDDCDAAIELYQRAFDVEVGEIARFGDMPGGQFPPEMARRVLQATLVFGDGLTRLSDSFGTAQIEASDRVAIAFSGTVSEVTHAFEVLAAEGRVVREIETTFFSPAYATVVDRFGVRWELSAEPQ